MSELKPCPFFGSSMCQTYKGDYVFVDERQDEEMSKIQISCGCDAVKITFFNALDWQAVAYFRREDPDLRALAKALLACCVEDGNDV